MTKDVIVSISGTHIGVVEDISGEEEEEILELLVPAKYYKKNGKHYFLYEEALEDVQGIIKNTIKISEDSSVEMIKTGSTTSHMVFEKGKKHMTYYQIPYGQILLEVNTTLLSVKETEDSLDVTVAYELDMEHEPFADCTVRIQAASKDSKAADEILKRN